MWCFNKESKSNVCFYHNANNVFFNCSDATVYMRAKYFPYSNSNRNLMNVRQSYQIQMHR